MTTYYLDPTDGLKRIGAMFGYNGRKYKITTADSVECLSHWDGGSRDYYKVLHSDGTLEHVSQNGTPFDHVQTPIVDITPNVIVAMHSISCGQDTGITLYVDPAVLPKMLPSADTDTLSRNEQIVLRAMGYKSAYRRQECARDGVTEDQYQEAIANLKSLGYLSANGALTTKGKNARAR